MKKKKLLKILLPTVFTIFCGYIFFKIIKQDFMATSKLLICFFVVLTLLGLFILTYQDLVEMSISNLTSLVLLLFLLLTNILLFFIYGKDFSLTIGNSFVFAPYNNFISTILLGSVFQLIVLLTKEKALGSGDVRLAMIVGLIIGNSNIFLWINITVFSALIFGFFYGMREKKFKGLKIPFVPFMILGLLGLLVIRI